jgi:hypothetical protein
MSESRMLRVSEPTGEVTRGWRKLNNEELHNLYYSPDVIMAIKSRGFDERGM